MTSNWFLSLSRSFHSWPIWVKALIIGLYGFITERMYMLNSLNTYIVCHWHQHASYSQCLSHAHEITQAWWRFIEDNICIVSFRRKNGRWPTDCAGPQTSWLSAKLISVITLKRMQIDSVDRMRVRQVCTWWQARNKWVESDSSFAEYSNCFFCFLHGPATTTTTSALQGTVSSIQNVSSSSSGCHGSPLSCGAIAGIVIGCVVFVAIVVVVVIVVILIMKKKKTGGTGKLLL
jgi:hypothetical protein